jgi:oxygen-independent coproporphyrinogen-3 oxidase
MEEMGFGGRTAATVFFGGGTPTLLEPDAIGRILDAVRETWGLAADAEVTVEANPDSVDAGRIRRLAELGVTRLSLGMQSAEPRVLAILDRTHDPEHVGRAVEAAHECGLAASVDLIYGTPGETPAEWEASLRAAIATGVGHISAYALTLEPHTPLARRIARGEVPPINPDAQAEAYEQAERILGEVGFTWYEISNFAREPAAHCRHNLGYWRGGDWWGIGPGAHSGLGADIGHGPQRWWNVKQPRVWAQRLAEHRSPEAGRDEPDAIGQMVERVMLGIRLAEGLDPAAVPPEGRAAVPDLIATGLLDPARAEAGRLVLTLQGRLLADTVTQALIA